MMNFEKLIAEAKNGTRRSDVYRCLDAMQARIKELETQNANLMREIKDMSRDNMRLDNASLDKRIAELEAENARLKKELSSIEGIATFLDYCKEKEITVSLCGSGQINDIRIFCNGRFVEVDPWKEIYPDEQEAYDWVVAEVEKIEQEGDSNE